jgi:hypothetical protein
MNAPFRVPTSTRTELINPPAAHPHRRALYRIFVFPAQQAAGPPRGNAVLRFFPISLAKHKQFSLPARLSISGPGLTPQVAS